MSVKNEHVMLTLNPGEFIFISITFILYIYACTELTC